MATVDVVTVADIRAGIELGRVDIEQVRDLAPGMAELRYRMGTGASVTALLVEPDEAPLAAVLVVHPATGDRMSLLADAHALSQHRVRCLLPELPREQSGTVDEGVASRVADRDALRGAGVAAGPRPNSPLDRLHR